MEAYETVAETVGFLPNLRAGDNISQIIVTAVCALIGAGAGAALPIEGAPVYAKVAIGAVLGVIVGVFASGVVLMVLGWVRLGKKLK